MNIGIIIIIAILIFFLGISISCLILIPKIKQREKIDNDVKEQNAAAVLSYQIACEKDNHLKEIINQKTELLDKLSKQVQDLQDTATKKANEYYNKALETAQNQFSIDLEKSRDDFEKAKSAYSNEYISVMKNMSEEYLKENEKISQTIEKQKQKLTELNEQLQKENAIVDAAISANKRAAEMNSKVDFYRLQIPEEDRKEMAEIRKCFQHLRNPEPLNKVIWKVYYEKPTTDLIGRVIGTGTHCGIYKITNTTTGQCYVGQSNDLASRWKQHIKRGIGADIPTKNKLYPAMLEIGVENFTFEVIEECSQELLTEKEKFWTDYFKAQEFGYSIRKG